MPPTPAPIGLAPGVFLDELLRSGLLIATGVPGVYGRSGDFERTVDEIDRLITAAGRESGAETMRFPPVLNRAHFERSGYLQSFPHLAGTVHTFAGGDRAHRELLQAVEGHSDWSASFAATDVVLTPAACYPVYPALTGRLPREGRLIDVMSYCFRHEPSSDAGRMQMFRMHEQVKAAESDALARWREEWLGRAVRLVAGLGLDARVQVAADPFFGRGGVLLAEAQRDRRLKLEITAPIDSDDCPTALVSLNDHQDHFAELFDIETATGGRAHTSCIGFGLERLALALYRRHGFDRSRWPPSVRDGLGS